MALVTLAHGFLAWRYFGFRGDELEVVETAFRRLGILTYQPWDIRNLLLPELVVSPAVAVARAIGVEDRALLLWIAGLPLVLCASVNVVLLHQLAHAWSGERVVAETAALLYVCHWIPLAYGATVHPRTAATTCVLASALLLSGSGRDLLRGGIAGILLALAFACRYSEIIFLVPLLGVVWLGSEDPRRRTLALGTGLVLGVLLAVGVYDLLTWGRPFASLEAFARYTLIEKKASSLRANQPPIWYLRRVSHWVPVTFIPLFAFAWRRPGGRRATLFVIAPLLVLSAIHHKSLRYLQGVIPFLCLLAALGVMTLWKRAARKTAVALIALSCFWGVYRAPRWLDRDPLAAVLAARVMAAEGARVVVLEQSWAFGGGLYLTEGTQIRELPTPPLPGGLEAMLPGSDWAALYRDELHRQPQLRAILERHNFHEERTITHGNSRTVVLFRSVQN